MEKHKLTISEIKDIASQVGDTFYYLHEDVFDKNYHDMLLAFRNVYPNTHIAYSYKTNYLPAICRMINDNGGYAEVVSEMELQMAVKNGVDYRNIYYNGPYKKEEYFEWALLKGVNINIDAYYEIEYLKKISSKYLDRSFNIGIRCALDINQEKPSRVGFDYENGDLQKAIDKISNIENVHLRGLHCHLPYRSLESFKKRKESFVEMLSGLELPEELDYISFGGGYMGEISYSAQNEVGKCSSDVKYPTYKDYADVVAEMMSKLFKKNEVKLIIEPGTALVANAMSLISKVISIKTNQEKTYVTLSASTYNMNPSVKDFNRPIEVVRNGKNRIDVKESDFVGYTCIEGDILYHGYSGNIAENDYVIFDNVGSYSLVMKPPFILPDIAIVAYKDDLVVFKQKQNYEDIFRGIDIE